MCGRQFVYQSDGKKARVFQLRCRSWTCPRCRPKRIKQLKHLAHSGHPQTFITLTCNPHLHESPGAGARAMSRAWRILRGRIERRYKGIQGQYFTVVEATKRGWPHLHVLTSRRWIDQKWLSEQWNELTGAPIVDVRRVQNARQMAAYVAKYVGKAPMKFLHLKRYYRTRGWIVVRPAPKPQHDWSNATSETLPGCFLTMGTALQAAGWTLEETGCEYWLLTAPVARGSPHAPHGAP